MRRFAASLLVPLLAPAGLFAGPAAADTSALAVDYRPPVDATPLVDTFRPPATPYGAGNRGIDYATAAGQAVHAAADGEVVFAGRIGGGAGDHHVVVLHADGLRSSYSFLAGATVRRGDRVRQGEPVGTTDQATPLHFGVRAGEAYLDPLVVLGQVGGAARPRAYLVPDPDEHRPLAEVVERRRLLDAIRSAAATHLRNLGGRVADAVRRKVDFARVLADTAGDLLVPTPFHLVAAAARWESTACTSAAEPPAAPSPTGARRIALLVGGLGSATGETAVLAVDTPALGHRPEDVHQFSYAPDGRHPYTADHTYGDIGAAGGRLAERIEDLQRRHPGAAVDVLAHSQGGLVARSAITTHGADPATVITLGTPHRGADLATAGAALGGTTSGRLLVQAVAATTGHDAAATSIRQMSETSQFIDDLPERGWDPGRTHVLSIAARGDPVVPNHQSRLDPAAAHSVVVEPHGGSRLDDHERLAGSPEATREIQRALARQPPTCRSLPEALLDEAVGHHHSHQHDVVAMTLAVGGLYVDARLRAAVVPGGR